MPEALPTLLPPRTKEGSPLERAIERAQRVLWETQRPDGSWEGPCNLGPTTTAQVAVVLHHLGRLGADDAAAIARWLRAQQRADGSFVLYPSASEGHPGATACAWAALHLLEPRQERLATARAAGWLFHHGGIPRVLGLLEEGDLSALFLGIAGLLDPRRLPCPSVAFLRSPAAVRLLQTRFHSGVLMIAFELWAIVHRLRGNWGPEGPPPGSLDARTCASGLSLLRTFQNDNGSWNDSEVFSALGLVALPAAGIPADDPGLHRAAQWVERQGVRDVAGLHFDGFGSEVWATSFDLRGLLLSGVPPSDPDLARGLEWLAAAQLDTPMPRADNRQPGALLTGAWAFQRSNHTMPDCDDTGVVLSTLGLALQWKGEGRLAPALEARLREAVGRAEAWLVGMQNPDGGWSAYVWGLPGKKPGPMMEKAARVPMDQPLAMALAFLDPPASMSDPSTEDVTARVLHGLGSCGLTAEHPAVARALTFLQTQQCEDGAFWGRWVLNYLSSTAFVMMGVAAVGADLDASWIRRARAWVESKQNPDGGWGEGPDSYRHPRLAGVGPSMPPLTALVVQGLLAVGGRSPAVERGVAYLLQAQRPDGAWDNRDYLHVNIAPDTFFIYPEATRFYPPAALGLYASAGPRPARPAPVERRWSDAQLEAMRHTPDPVADAVVKAIYDRSDLAAVHAMMGKIFRSDDPVPPGLPPEAQLYFETTRVLPSWVDAKQLALAQDLFTRAGWQVAMGLFCASLPQAYAAADGAQVLTQTQGMTRHVKQRIFETAQFVFDVADEGGLTSQGRGVAAAQKVRLMHAGVRHLLLTRAAPAWDLRLGLPINQEDLAGTLMTFSVVVLDALRRLEVPVSTDEAEAWLHLWKAVGWVMGVREDLLPEDVADGQALMEAVRVRQWARSRAGASLIRPLIEMMQSYFPGSALDGLPVALVRHLAGDHCANLLELPPSDWTGLLLKAAQTVGARLDDGLERHASQLLAHATHLLMQGVVNVEREGKDAQFRIPRSLRRTVIGGQ